jgi:F0F1-type ATP synthase assembly protein I
MQYASTGMELVVIFGLLLAGGLWLDYRLRTLPLFTLIGALAGFGLGLWRMIGDFRRAQREMRRDPDARRDGPDGPKGRL